MILDADDPWSSDRFMAVPQRGQVCASSLKVAPHLEHTIDGGTTLSQVR
jgi:hypothetical protein